MVGASGRLSTEDVAAGLWGPDSVTGLKLSWSMRSARLILYKMLNLGLVRLPDMAGETWEVGEVGRQVLAELSAPPTPRKYKTSAWHRRRQRLRRQAASDLARCINENAAGGHGSATHGCRCETCHEVHRRSA